MIFIDKFIYFQDDHTMLIMVYAWRIARKKIKITYELVNIFFILY